MDERGDTSKNANGMRTNIVLVFKKRLLFRYVIFLVQGERGRDYHGGKSMMCMWPACGENAGNVTEFRSKGSCT